MAVMMLIMALPVLGLALFYIWPLSWALAGYLVLVAFSVFFDALMMRSMRTPSVTGAEALIGQPVTVLFWQGRSGQVGVRGEIWQASTVNGTSVETGEHLYIVRVEGLTLIVEPRPEAPPGEESAPRATSDDATKGNGERAFDGPLTQSRHERKTEGGQRK